MQNKKLPDIERTSYSNENVDVETAMFGAGCFWGVEDKLNNTPGVLSTQVGYAGGSTEEPTYKQVCSGKTGHAEVVYVEFDRSRISYNDLLELFFNMHNPTTMNRQGWDIGTQYRSVIFYYSGEQEKAAKTMIETLEDSGKFRNPIVTQVVAAPEFWRAEEYHQKYYQKHGGSCSN